MIVHRAKSSRCRARAGFSLVELLVVIGVIGLLVALTLPAVQAARESARRAQCLNNQRQLVVAMNGFVSQNGGFPHFAAGRPYEGQFLNHVSFYASLLPHLDQSALYHAVNFESVCSAPAHLELSNATAARTRLSVLLCPSDPHAHAHDPIAAVSYRGNAGLGERHVSPGGVVAPIDDGAFAMTPARAVLPPSAFRDGLSNTLAYSEKPIGSGRSGKFHPFRDYFPEGSGQTADEWVAVCSQMTMEYPTALDSGLTWLLASAFYTQFTVKLPPNSAIPDCSGDGHGHLGCLTARSYHPGGVVAAFADGSGRWFSSSTNASLWRRLGTRNRGD